MHYLKNRAALSGYLNTPACGLGVIPAAANLPLLLPEKTKILENHHDAGTDAELTRQVYIAAVKLTMRTQG